MKKILMTSLLLLALAAAQTLTAQSRLTENTLKLDSTSNMPVARIEDLALLPMAPAHLTTAGFMSSTDWKTGAGKLQWITTAMRTEPLGRMILRPDCRWMFL